MLPSPPAAFQSVDLSKKAVDKDLPQIVCTERLGGAFHFDDGAADLEIALAAIDPVESRNLWLCDNWVKPLSANSAEHCK